VKTRCGRVGKVVEISIEDPADYQTMRLKLQLAGTERRLQFSGDAEWYDLKGCDQKELLHYASRNGAVHAVSRLLASGAAVNEVCSPEDWTSPISNYAPLYWSALNGHIAVSRLLVLYKADPECRDAGGITPLHVAAEQGHTDVLAWLLEDVGVTVDPRDSDGDTPLHLAVYGATSGRKRAVHRQCVDTLLSAKANPGLRCSNNKTPLQMAVKDEDLKAMIHKAELVYTEPVLKTTSAVGRALASLESPGGKKRKKEMQEQARKAEKERVRKEESTAAQQIESIGASKAPSKRAKPTPNGKKRKAETPKTTTTSTAALETTAQTKKIAPPAEAPTQSLEPPTDAIEPPAVPAKTPDSPAASPTHTASPTTDVAAATALPGAGQTSVPTKPDADEEIEKPVEAADTQSELPPPVAPTAAPASVPEPTGGMAAILLACGLSDVRAETSAEGMEMVPAEGMEMVPAEGMEMAPAEGMEMVPAEGMEMVPAEGMEMVPAEGMEMDPAEDLQSPGSPEEGIDEPTGSSERHPPVCNQETPNVVNPPPITEEGTAQGLPHRARSLSPDQTKVLSSKSSTPPSDRQGQPTQQPLAVQNPPATPATPVVVGAQSATMLGTTKQESRSAVPDRANADAPDPTGHGDKYRTAAEVLPESLGC